MDIIVPNSNIEEILAHPLVVGLLDSVSDGALVIDAQDRSILAMNKIARDLLDYAQSDVLGCQCSKMMNSPACTTACPLSAALEGRRKKQQLELYYRGRDGGGMLHAHTRMLLIKDPQGKPLAGVELFADLRQVRHLKQALGTRKGLRGIIGTAPAMQKLYEMVEQVGPYTIPVLITGESGVGKERFADAVHYYSPRAERPLVKINCAGFSQELVESELFGHRRGSFTGALGDRRGYFEEASGGSLMLDEVGELPARLQAKLLRVLQEGEIQRIGEDRARKVDVRIIAATNRNLEQEVSEGRFRQDLFYRLLGARLHIPPLRERPEDIPALADFFIQRFGNEFERPDLKLDPAAKRTLLQRSWPGNVRELENSLRLACISALTTGKILAEHLQSMAGPINESRELVLDLAELERRAIEEAMTRSGGNTSAAARLLGIDRTTLWRKLKKDQE